MKNNNNNKNNALIFPPVSIIGTQQFAWLLSAGGVLRVCVCVCGGGGGAGAGG